MTGETATRLVLSYPNGLSEWGHDQIETERYRRYLRRVFETPTVGDESEEFVDVGCCGSSLDLTFRVEDVEGGDRVDDDTEVELVPRDGEVEGGWRVQSAGGPR
ncbi:hypothetical protein HUG10_10305 [Halorarum halophilum]|uniref:DUF7968 domain-containing protein n=1 Tax=Halorarum halophilum TaxID=2743090 RepID=A0A7D5K1I4_9EURY|nr:hypothetical protein [Halobaculum halophilum]QLG27921.1 hypothetical protein HUG10_10305 [Halobaculum halophilum]